MNMIKELLRASVWCLFIALVLNLAFGQGLVPSYGNDYAWLRIEGIDPGGRNRPEQIVIYTSVKPSVVQIHATRWQITFQK